jgi:tellurite resistance protein
MLSWKNALQIGQSFLNSPDFTTQMDIQKREIYRAIAEIAYVVAKSDKGLSSEERIAFNKIIETELDYESWVAQSRFDLLDEVTQPSINEAYNEAINNFRKYKDHLTPELKEKALRVFIQVAETCGGFSEKEKFVIDRFKQDLREM